MPDKRSSNSSSAVHTLFQANFTDSMPLRVVYLSHMFVSFSLAVCCFVGVGPPVCFHLQTDISIKPTNIPICQVSFANHTHLSVCVCVCALNFLILYFSFTHSFIHSSIAHIAKKINGKLQFHFIN